MIDLILHNARIVTQWPDQPLAQAIAVQKGRIIAVGSDDEILALASPGTRLIDARGRLALPAFTDAHIHLFDLARRRGQVALYEAASLDDMLARVQAHAAGLPPDAWVLGYGWNESAWPERRFPTRHDLDAITGGRPAVIWRTDLHAAVANTEALRRAGIGPDTPNSRARHTIAPAAIAPQSAEKRDAPAAGVMPTSRSKVTKSEPRKV